MKQTPPTADLLKLLQKEPVLFEVNSTPSAHVHTVAIDEEFQHVSQFAQLVDVLENATENDVVRINLTSPGGTIQSIIPVISAINNTAAIVHVHVMSDIASAATCLMMKADMVTFNRMLSVMIHTSSWGYGGHSGNMEASTKHLVRSTETLIRDMYTDFLTEDEIQRVMNGLEIWLTPEECVERLLAREKKQEAEQPAEE